MKECAHMLCVCGLPTERDAFITALAGATGIHGVGGVAAASNKVI